MRQRRRIAFYLVYWKDNCILQLENYNHHALTHPLGLKRMEHNIERGISQINEVNSTIREKWYHIFRRVPTHQSKYYEHIR